MKYLYFALLLLLCKCSFAQTITTVAGTGKEGYSGDGGPAISAELGDLNFSNPEFDHLGNMYIAQGYQNTIRRIDPSGIITTIAGTPYSPRAYTGDGGPAINARLCDPTAIAIDNANNIYFIDGVGAYIRKIDQTGLITTVSGQRTEDCGNGDSGQLISAKFKAIISLTFDKANNLYISDYSCSTVRKVNAVTGIITTIAGNGKSGYSGDGGPATSAQLNYPCKVAVDNAGNVYIPDASNHRIRKVDAATGIITTIAGNGIRGYNGDGGLASNANINGPESVVIDNAGNVYFSDNYNYVIRKIDVNGIISTYAGNGSYGYSGDGGPALNASITFNEGKMCIYNDDIYFPHYTGPISAIRKVSNYPSPIVTKQPSNVSICDYGTAVFSITASNVSSYQWQKYVDGNWANIMTEFNIYSGTTTNTLTIARATTALNNMQYRCMLNSGCGTAYTLPALLEVTTTAMPGIVISTQTVDICAGDNIGFSASAENGGTAPTYMWLKNGLAVGINNKSYIDNSLNDKDVISCNLISNATCLVKNSATSNQLTINVRPLVQTALTIAPSENDFCYGTPVTFTATPVNGGDAPDFTWFKNGQNLLLNSTTYTDKSLNNGDVIMGVMQSSLACPRPALTLSAPYTVSVKPLVTPSVIVTSSANPICKNTPVTFTATPTNGGNAPVYQWKKNGTNIGSNLPKYVDAGLKSGDLIACNLISNSNCLTTTSALSNEITTTFLPDPIVNLDQTEFLCNGDTRILDAGNFTAYLWNNGSTKRTVEVNNTGVYTVTVTDNSGCKGTGQASINKLLQPPAHFLPSDTSVCVYGDLLLHPNTTFNSYLWNTGSNIASISVSKPGDYWLSVTDNNGCSGKETVHVKQKDCLVGFFMPNAFTPNSDGKNDVLKPTVLGRIKQYQFWIYDRWGQLIFYSTDFNKGWDGSLKGLPQNGGSFIWQCIYQFEGEPVQKTKGTFVLIR